MECEFCKCDPDPVYLVPFPDGSRDVMTCHTCAVTEGVYCVLHDVRHTLFPGTTACLRCIEATVQSLRKDTQKLIALIGPMVRALAPEDQKRVWETARAVRNIMTDPAVHVPVLRWVATLAHCRKVSVATIIRDVRAGKLSANDLLPFPF